MCWMTFCLLYFSYKVVPAGSKHPIVDRTDIHLELPDGIYSGPTTWISPITSL